MIDWWMVASNGLWIFGLALLLAAFSYHDWLAAERGWPRREVFSARSFRAPWTTGLFLTFGGWALARSGPWWERVPWGVVAVWCGWRMLQSWRPSSGPRPPHGHV
jgi:hypothetical protein